MSWMTPTQFGWFTTVFVGVMSFGWFAVDVRNLIVTRNLDRRDPLVRDRRFAYVMGVIMTTIGIIGTLRFHAVL